MLELWAKHRVAPKSRRFKSDRYGKNNNCNTEYDTGTMIDNTKAQVASLQFLEAHISELQNEVAVFETARRAYTQALTNSVE